MHLSEVPELASLHAVFDTVPFHDTASIKTGGEYATHKQGEPWVCKNAYSNKTYYVFPDGEVEMSIDITLYITEPDQSDDAWWEENEDVFDCNITHNLCKMAKEAGIYTKLWHPEEEGITKAQEWINPLIMALADMRDRPDHFKKFDAPNGWGTYDDFVPWLQELLDACQAHPDAFIYVSI